MVKFYSQIALFAVLFISINRSFGQLLPVNYDTLEVTHEVFINGGLDYYGTAIQNDLISKFTRGGHVSEEIKDNSFDKHKAINRIGATAGGDIEYRNFKKRLFKSKNWGFNVKAGYHVFAGLLYSKDAFGAVFYGNDRYIGETIDMSGAKMSFVNYQKVGIGLIDAKSKSNVSLNFYNISNRLSGSLNKAEIYQHTTGHIIDVTLEGEFELKRNNKFSQGVGIGLDADFKIPVKWLNDRAAFIQVQAQNIGVAYMHEKQKVYSFDTTFTYTGLSVNDLIGDESIFNESFNALDTLGINSTEKNRTFMLPGFIQVGKIVDDMAKVKWQSFFGVRMYTTLLYSPLVFGGVDYKPASWVNIGANLSYGGFGKLRGGIYTSFKFDKYSIGISSENVAAWFTKKSSGQSAFIRLRCAI